MVKFYICETCKNIITKIVDSKVPVVCCGRADLERFCLILSAFWGRCSQCSEVTVWSKAVPGR